MRVKRILSTIVAFAVALCSVSLPKISGGAPPLSVTASAVDASVDGIGASRERVRRNETFDITVNVPPTNATADTIQMKLVFDPAVFEVTIWNPQVSTGSPMKNLNNEKGFAIFAVANSNVSLVDGLTVSATVRAKDYAPTGTHTFKLAMAEVSNFDTDFSWTPSVTEVSVKVVDRLVSVSGKVSMTALELPASFSGTADVSLTDSSGKSIDQVITLTKVGNSNVYEGYYNFSEAESEASYVVQASADGFRTHIETISTGFASVTRDMPLNLKGDVNSDGEIDAKDATQILRYLVNSRNLIKGDDGVVNEYLLSVACVEGSELSPRDATQILRKVAGFSSVFDSI